MNFILIFILFLYETINDESIKLVTTFEIVIFIITYLWKTFFSPFFLPCTWCYFRIIFYLDAYCEALKKLAWLVFTQCASPLLAVRCKQVSQWKIFSPPSLVVHSLIASSVEMQVSLVKPSSSIQLYRWFECFLASV